MSRLDELIQELCPEGVEYKPLASISHYSGERIDAKDVDCDNYVGVDNLLPDKQGKTTSDYVPEEGKVIAFHEGDILIGNIRPYLKKIWRATHDGGTNGDVLVICSDDVVDSEYLFYCLSSDLFFYYDMQHAKGAKMPRGDKRAIMEFEVPVPPLEVQREIVCVLDYFTLLRQELSAELSARRKQYEYYRDELLTFDTGIPKMKLGETCDMKAGKAISSVLISDVKTEDTPIACYGGNGIRGYVKDYNKEGNYPIIGRQGALCGNVTFAIGKFYATEHAVVVESKGAYSQRFLYHLLTHMELNQYKSAGAQPGLSVKNLNELYAPVPPISVQNRIVNVLDNFEVICNDLNIGLPAEINARTKQYEFYRDQLLTFAETGKTILTDRQTDRHGAV